ncbi:type IV pilus modification protein PilV [Psychromonas sp.]|nr:type IV pilus modification protein PilV [Psychromonas sp.]
MIQRGFSLLEIMISSFILALGLLGLAGMQSTAVKSSVEIQQRTLANSLLSDISERMQLNKGWLKQTGNSYAINSLIDAELTQPDCIGSGGVFVNCSGEDVKNNDLYEWKDKFIGAHVVSATGIESGLIGADACIEADSTGKSMIVLSWYSTVKSLDAAIDSGSTSLSFKCGEASLHRRQLSVQTYISKSS